MQSVIGISENLIGEYQALYAELSVPEHQRTLERLKRTILEPGVERDDKASRDGDDKAVSADEKGGAS